ncbi:LiaF domain-containing protein [Thalassotalea piscium]
MSVVIEDRPIESVREEVIDQLIMNYSHGKLSYEAFERRLDVAMESKSNVEIAALTEDLELDVDPNYVESKRRDFSTQYTAERAEENDLIVNIFGGSKRRGRWMVAKEIRSLTVFGGTELDFTDAQFSQPDIKMSVFCLFGGVDIYVPENVNIISKAFCIFGGVDNTAPCLADRNSPTIIIEGFVMFGGIDIKLKRTIKEKFVAFADNMKNMFN